MLRLKQIAATLAVLALPMVGQATAAGKHARHTGHARKHPRAPQGTQTTPGAQSPTPAGTTAAGAQPASKRGVKRRHLHVGLASASAHAASDPADTISDFKFTPGSLTVHVGDTVTWTNVGPTAHTATAHDHSFDTGFLTRGQSASHTFTHAGTFAYICTLHPYMKGTIVVLASSGSGQTGGSGHSGGSGGSNTSNNASTAGANGSGNSTPSSTNPASTGTSNGLPNTGLNLVLTMLVALALIGLGVTLRRGRRSSP